MSRIRVASVVGLALALAGCASVRGIACERGEQPAVHDSLYFGTATPTGVVTPEEWSAFLRETVTPRFPQGLTVWQASGQWRTNEGGIVREGSYVLDLVHPDDMPNERAVLEIVVAYKSRFRQEAVLRLQVESCASF